MPETVRARWAVATIFLVNGVLIGSWAPEVPVVRDRLGLGEVELGTLLLVMAVGAAVAMPFSGFVIARTGSAPLTRIASLVMVLALPAVVLLPGHAMVHAAAFVFGAGIGLCDVGMNAHAVVVERRLGRPIMSGLHGMFSVGGFAASAAGGLFLAYTTPAVHVGTVTAICLVALAAALRHLLPAHADKAEPGAAFALPTGGLLLIGLLTFVVFMAEGAMVDWSAVHLRDSLGAGPGLAAAGYAAFAAAMAIGRFSGDAIRSRFSAVFLVLGGALAGGTGLAVGTLSGNPYVMIAGLFVTGLGLANLVPVFFTAAGRTPGVAASTGVAAAATAGYFGLLAGPPLIGFVAAATSLDAAFVMLATGCVAVGFAARAARAADRP